MLKEKDASIGELQKSVRRDCCDPLYFCFPERIAQQTITAIFSLLTIQTIISTASSALYDDGGASLKKYFCASISHHRVVLVVRQQTRDSVSATTKKLPTPNRSYPPCSPSGQKHEKTMFAAVHTLILRVQHGSHNRRQECAKKWLKEVEEPGFEFFFCFQKY